MDVDAYVARHRAEWDRLDQLVRRRRRSGADADELVDLYQRVAGHLSVVRTRSPDPALVDRLSGLVTRARAAVGGGTGSTWADVTRFVLVSFPLAVYVRRRWVLATAAASLALALAVGVWVAHSTTVQNAVASPEQVRQLVEQDFASYYRSAPAGSFAAKVWTNNAWVTALAITFGALLGLPTLLVMMYNAVNVGVDGGLLAAYGRTGEFFTLILPHGLLELSAVFVAGGTGLRLGWTFVEPGPSRRLDALAAEARGAVGVAVGLVGVLAVSGMLEAFLTPSPLPPWLRLAVGGSVWLAFVAYVARFGRRAAAAVGGTGDLDPLEAGALLPVA